MTYGYGLLLKEEQSSLLVLMSEKETMPELLPCGSHFLKTAKRTEYFSQTAWPLTEKYFLRKDTALSVKEAEKQVISKGLI
ncbi:MAG: hypothetical protein CDV28_101173 [Candidatus Electronema aureum]|uniref:Uncharacterized protein n=1 Tax=Candidatus Electronema aureum TaxID=2005002 RepID=A0A521G5P0_9BACT|nr:MAG: hypothetical protein CDV28_101173 [Candidatus Electronema aureum]